MPRVLVTGLLALLLLVASCGGGDAPEIDLGLPTKQMSAEDRARIDKVATDMIEGRLGFSKGQLPGLWIGIWDPEIGVYVQAYGKSDVAGNRDAEPDDFVRIASITKTFVATVVLQLVDEGKLRLSDTVEQHLPKLVERFPELRGRTVRQLLSMRSGLPDNYEAWAEELSSEPTRTVEPERIVELALRKPTAAAGTPGYSNTNYILLGQIAEAVTGTPLDELIADRVSEPLGIPDAHLVPNDRTSLPEPAAHGYAFECENELDTLGAAEGDDLTDRSWSGALGAGGMVARFSDLGVWGASAFGNALLPKALAAERLRGQPLRFGEWYGLGIFGVDNVFGGNWIGHGGDLPGWQSVLLHNRKTGATVAMLTTTCSTEDLFLRDVLPLLYPR